MLKRFNELNFVIGLFFLLVSLILLGSTFFSKNLSGSINIYTGIAFLVFGLLMILIRQKNSGGQ
jgi:hypothetical protein